jgi:shikimate kinase
MMNLKKSISFVGMAGCGKTTIGRLFAKKHRVSFIDTDHLIEKKLNKSLQDIKDEKGYMYLREIEQEIVLAIDTSIQIISTGGSVIYSEQAITYLKQISSVVFIDTPYELIKKRIGDASDRGFSVPDGFSVKEAFDERMPMYQKHQDFTVDGANSEDYIIKSIEQWI